MNLANYPNKAASWLNGVSLGTLTCMQVYRDNNRAAPNYIAVVRDGISDTVRSCSYAMIGKAFSRKDIVAARHAFDQGSLLAPKDILDARHAFVQRSRPGSTAAVNQPDAAVPGAPGLLATPKVASSGLNAASNVNDEDAAMAMMAALVRFARTNPRVANIVKTMATLVN